MDGKRIVPSTQKKRQASRAAICGAIIRHFNFHRDIFIIRLGMRKRQRGANMIDKTFKRQQALHLKA
jgi:uncharacterized membrane protein